jgi:hypothetical protein
MLIDIMNQDIGSFGLVSLSFILSISRNFVPIILFGLSFHVSLVITSRVSLVYEVMKSHEIKSEIA